MLARCYARSVAEIRPFCALRYDVARAGPVESLVAPAYDVIGPEERVELLSRSPYNVVHLTLPDSEEQAGARFRAWQEQGILVRETDPATWLLTQTYAGPDAIERTRTALLAALRVEPYERGVVLPHERTHRGPKEGRLRLLRAVRAQLEPILLVYDGEQPFTVPTGPPVLAADGTRLWRLPPDENVAAAFADRQLLIADGHHRYETALAFQQEQGTPESAFMLAALVSTKDAGLTIFPTHRIARAAPELNAGLRLTSISGGPGEGLRVLEALTRDHAAFVEYRKGSTVLAEALEETLDSAAVGRLGLEDVRYTPHVEEAVSAVDSGQADAAFLVRAPTIEQVVETARAGRTMPQKSTYFFPKLPSGLLFLPLEPVSP